MGWTWTTSIFQVDPLQVFGMRADERRCVWGEMVEPRSARVRILGTKLGAGRAARHPFARGKAKARSHPGFPGIRSGGVQAWKATSLERARLFPVDEGMVPGVPADTRRRVSEVGTLVVAERSGRSGRIRGALITRLPDSPGFEIWSAWMPGHAEGEAPRFGTFASLSMACGMPGAPS